MIEGMGGRYAHTGRVYGDTQWVFECQEIFKRAVLGMAGACNDVLEMQGVRPEDIALVIPHQANLRIIEAVAKRAGVGMDRVFVNVQKYGNMSAATVPVAQAVEWGGASAAGTLVSSAALTATSTVTVAPLP